MSAQETPVTDEVWAFWKYDNAVGLLAGRVTHRVTVEQVVVPPGTSPERVRVSGYGRGLFTPEFEVEGERGKLVACALRDEEEAARKDIALRREEAARTSKAITQPYRRPEFPTQEELDRDEQEKEEAAL